MVPERHRRRRAWLHRFSSLGTCRRVAGWNQKHTAASAHAESPQPQSDLTETAMSRTIKFAKAGGPEVLEFVEVQVPAPGPNEVRIKVKAIGINRAEAMWRVQHYKQALQKVSAGLCCARAGQASPLRTGVGACSEGCARCSR